MGRADFYSHGNPNYICDRCGQKFKRSQIRKTWDGFMVCHYDYEIRHPQDFLKSRYDKQSFADPRPDSCSQEFTESAQETELTCVSEPLAIDVFLDTNEVTVDDLCNQECPSVCEDFASIIYIRAVDSNTVEVKFSQDITGTGATGVIFGGDLENLTFTATNPVGTDTITYTFSTQLFATMTATWSYGCGDLSCVGVIFDTPIDFDPLDVVINMGSQAFTLAPQNMAVESGTTLGTKAFTLTPQNMTVDYVLGAVELNFNGDTWIEIPGYSMDRSGPGRITMVVESSDNSIVRDMWSSSERDDHFELQANPTEADYTIGGVSTGNVCGVSDQDERHFWEFTWDRSPDDDKVYKDAALELNSFFTSGSTTDGFNIGVNQAQSGSFFKGIIKRIEVYDAQTGGNLVNSWAIDDNVADTGTIVDSEGSANGTLHLGTGSWVQTYLPQSIVLSSTDNVLLTYAGAITDNGAAAADWLVRTIGRSSDQVVNASSISVVSNTITVTFPATSIDTGETSYLYYQGDQIDTGSSTATRFAELQVTT